MNRRDFLKVSVGAASASSLLLSCQTERKWKGAIVGASANIGHLLRDKDFSAPEETVRTNVVIVGGGVSGLTAAYRLSKSGETDFLLLDLEKEPGGNAAQGSNAVSAFPWGAHYVPTPNNDLTEYLAFLKECGVITGEDRAGLPIYSEAFLCFDPQERLYINGRWQDGMVPHFGVPETEQQQIQRFLQLMDVFRHQKGSDGRDAFAIPVNASSLDEQFTRLDTLTMQQWMNSEGFTSPYLQWYVNYCTRDDFGTPLDRVSAWAGIHYFASRKGRGNNADYSDVLTWPEGNGFLVNQLSRGLASQIRCGNLVVSVRITAEGVHVVYYDTRDNKVKAVLAKQGIMAVPQFIAARLLHDPERVEKVQANLAYAPWMVANLTVKNLEERTGAPLSWDNVIYGSNSLGYVEATHSFVQQRIPKRNLTYYLPLTEATAIEERKKAQHRSFDEWANLVLTDLVKVHPNIEVALEELNIMIWGHAMAQPLPGMVHGNLRKELAASIANKLHFAHTDLAGASMFEEAFYQGLAAAKNVLKNGRRYA